MSIALSEHQYEMGGVAFGRGLPLVVQKFDPGSAEWTVQDADNPVGDGTIFGRDYLRPPTWTWDLGADTYSAAEGFALLGSLGAAWRTAGRRDTPGAVTTLRYAVAGRTRRVYGRPRRWVPVRDKPVDGGWVQASADFALVDPLFYDDAARSTSISLVVSSQGGWTWPATWPISTVGAGVREGVIDDVGGDAPTGFIATITGPIANPWISGPGWKIALSTTVAYDKTITIDTRPWVNTVTITGGGSVAGSLSRTSRLSTARLSPGPAALSFGGTDATRTALCTISWWPAWHTQ